MAANALFTDWVTGDLITAAKLNLMKNSLVNQAGDTMTGTLITPSVQTRSAINAGDVVVNTPAGVARWLVYKSTVETGSNVGSDFTISRYADGGSGLGNVLTLVRSNGNAIFSNNISAISGLFSNLVTAAGGINSTSNLNIGGTNTGHFQMLTPAGLARWYWATSNSETGSGNVGSDLSLFAYSDAGGLLSTPIAVTRASGAVAFSGVVNANNRAVIFPTANATDFSTAALEVRGDNSKRPRIAFHNPGVAVAQIVLNSAGQLAVMDNPGTGLSGFTAGAGAFTAVTVGGVDAMTDQSTRFTMCVSVRGGVSITATSSLQFGAIAVFVPTGKNLYVRRIRSVFLNNLRGFVFGPVNNVTATAQIADDVFNTIIFNGNNTVRNVAIGVSNTTAAAILTFADTDSVWVEFEIR